MLINSLVYVTVLLSDLNIPSALQNRLYYSKFTNLKNHVTTALDVVLKELQICKQENFERLGPLLDLSSLAGTNFPADATACAVSKCLEPSLDPGSLADTNYPADATACVVMTRPMMLHVQQSFDS